MKFAGKVLVKDYKKGKMKKNQKTLEKVYEFETPL
jgi:hypothetical protein